MPNIRLRKIEALLLGRPFWLLFFLCVAPGSSLYAQSVPCLLAHGYAPNAWVNKDMTPLAPDATTSKAQLRALYTKMLNDAEQLPDTDPCKARALFYSAVFFQTDETQKAIDLQKRVLAIDETALPPGHPRYALDLLQLAQYYESAKEPQEAEPLYQRALNLAQGATGITVFERMMAETEAAAFYERQKQFPQAEALCRQALELSAKLQPSLADWSLNIRSQLAHILQEEGNTNQADAVLNEPTRPIPAWPAQSNLSAAPDLSGPLSDIARAKQFSFEGNQEDAETSYLHAISTLEKIDNFIAQSDLNSALDGLAEFYRLQHRYPEAERTLSRALDLWESISVTSGSGFAAGPPLGVIQGLYFDEKRPDIAQALYQRVLDVQDRMLPRDDFSISRTLIVLADAYRQEGNYEATLPLLERSLPIEEKKWGADSPLLAGTLDPYATALEKVGRPEEAAAIRARIRSLRKPQSAQ